MRTYTGSSRSAQGVGPVTDHGAQYVSIRYTERLAEADIELSARDRHEGVTHQKKPQRFSVRLLHKRAIIGMINDQIKNIQQIEHTRHRSRVNAMVKVLAALMALYAPTAQTVTEYLQK